MDTTIRLNLLLIILISAICGLVIKETLYDKSVLAKEAASGHAGKPRQNNSNVRSDSESLLIEKILSLKNSDKYDPGQARPDNLDAAPLQNPVPHIHDIAQDRLYKGAGQSAASFTMEKRGKWMALPAGFTQATTNSYVIYREEEPVNKELRKYLDNIHGNFVLDILPFSVVSDFDRIFVMLFKSKDKYSQYTSMPQWSSATTDLNSNAVYIMENYSFKGNFVHELSHIYYDGFFKPTLSPLWMSEGFAVKMQTAVQTERENGWLLREKEAFKNGNYITFNEFLNAQNLSNYSRKDATTWYAQAYSVIDYLLQNKTRDEFYQFSKNIKEGMSLAKAMYRAYGMPFNTTKALEYAWQADLQKDMYKQPQGDK